LRTSSAGSRSRRRRSPGANPNKSYKFWLTDIGNYIHVFVMLPFTL
jgi:hypothetical protein